MMKTPGAKNLNFTSLIWRKENKWEYQLWVYIEGKTKYNCIVGFIKYSWTFPRYLIGVGCSYRGKNNFLWIIKRFCLENEIIYKYNKIENELIGFWLTIPFIVVLTEEPRDWPNFEQQIKKHDEQDL